MQENNENKFKIILLKNLVVSIIILIFVLSMMISRRADLTSFRRVDSTLPYIFFYICKNYYVK